MKTENVDRYEMAIPVQTLVTFLRERFPEIPEGVVVHELDVSKDYTPKVGPYPVKSIKVRLERVLHQEGVPEGEEEPAVELSDLPPDEAGSHLTQAQGHSVDPTEAV